MIFGQGNVAIDVARILLSPVELLKVTISTCDCVHYCMHMCVKYVGQCATGIGRLKQRSTTSI